MTPDPDDVVLLSGGNPQIAKGDGDEPLQAYLEAMPEWKGEIGRHIDDLVREVVPQALRAVRWNSPFYGIEGNGWFLSLHCFTKYVKITWLNGSELDPNPPGTSKQQRVRYLDIRQHDEIDDDQIRQWLRQAVTIPGDKIF